MLIVCILFFFVFFLLFLFFFLFQAEDGIRDLVRSRGLGDVYKRQGLGRAQRADAVVDDADLDALFLLGDQQVGELHALSLIHI